MIKTTLGKDTDFLAITVEQAKAWCRIEVDEDDSLVAGLIRAATSAAEAFTSRTITPSTVELQYSGVLKRIPLETAPISDVSTVELEDSEGVRETLTPNTDYYVRLHDAGALLVLSKALSKASVIATCSAGYIDAEEVPQVIKQAIAVHVGSAYMNREGQDTAKATFESLLMPFVIGGF